MSTDTSFITRSREENWLPVLELAVEEVFEIMLGCRVKPVAQAEHPPNAEFTAMIGLAGALCGVITVCCSAKSAGQMATKMLGDAAASQSEVGDALGEICNMIAGNFQSGSAHLMAASEAALDRIAGMLGKHNYRLRIEGYTDNTPIHTAQFPSNWELSTSRATEIVRVFIVREGFSPDRLSAAGYGEYHPLASNLTVEGRSANRRVDIVILSRDSDPTSPNPPASQAPAPAGAPNAGSTANKASPTPSPATIKPTAGKPLGEALQQ
jgi:outer membrane protein OmpA-like peptidoglycan-associated protein